MVAHGRVPTLCSSCKISYSPESTTLKKLGIEERNLTLYKSNKKGCTRCDGGYAGKRTLYQVVLLTPLLKRNITKIQDHLEENPFNTDALQLLKSGKTDLDAIADLIPPEKEG